MIILIVQIHPRPTVAERQVLPWGLTQKLAGLHVREEFHRTGPADGGSYFGAGESCGHAATATERCYPVAKLADPVGRRLS